MPCKNLDSCPIPGKSGVGAIYRKRYCDGNWSACARLTVLEECGAASVPAWLKPNMAPEADTIIARVMATG